MKRRALLLTFSVVLALCAACGWWLHRERQQYARNRQLIAALVGRDTQQALVLVNAGADPNTHLTPPAPPSLELLLRQWLHHMPLPSDNSPTAFVLACATLGDGSPDSSLPFVPLAENLPLLQTMLAHGANIHARILGNRTALHYAVVEERPATVQWLLQQDTDVNVQDDGGQTPLMWAGANDTMDVARVLLTHGANPNVADGEGNTALHHFLGSTVAESFLPELLAHGADPTVCNKDGLTPFQVAQQAGRSNAVRLLKRVTK